MITISLILFSVILFIIGYNHEKWYKKKYIANGSVINTKFRKKHGEYVIIIAGVAFISLALGILLAIFSLFAFLIRTNILM